MGNGNYPPGVTDADFLTAPRWEYETCGTCLHLEEIPQDWLGGEVKNKKCGWCPVLETWCTQDDEACDNWEGLT